MSVDCALEPRAARSYVLSPMSLEFFKVQVPPPSTPPEAPAEEKQRHKVCKCSLNSCARMFNEEDGLVTRVSTTGVHQTPDVPWKDG